LCSQCRREQEGVRQFVACTGEAKWCNLFVDHCALSERLRAFADPASPVEELIIMDLRFEKAVTSLSPFVAIGHAGFAPAHTVIEVIIAR
jgi:hypothetical protein